MQRSSKDIDQIIDSLDGISRAEARPFMHTRVLAKLKEENNFWGRTVTFLTRPAVVFACLASVAVANIYTVIKSDTSEQQETTTVASNSVSEILHNDNYVLAVNNDQ